MGRFDCLGASAHAGVCDRAMHHFTCTAGLALTAADASDSQFTMRTVRDAHSSRRTYMHTGAHKCYGRFDGTIEEWPQLAGSC